MPNPDHTEPSRLDLSDDLVFAKLVKRHLELTELLRELRQAENERKEIAAEIIAKLGNAQSATTDDAVISTQTVRRPEYHVAATIYQVVKVRHRVKRKEAV
jgi:hypothetical protein